MVVDSKRNEYTTNMVTVMDMGTVMDMVMDMVMDSDDSYYTEEESKKEKTIFAKIKSYFKS